MSLDTQDVAKIAHLARLSLDDGQTERYAADLSRILDLVEQMNRASTEGIDALAHPLDVTQRLREDAVTELDQRERFQATAPRVENGLYLVPKVIE